MFGSTETNRFAYINFFDPASETFGSHVAASQMDDDYYADAFVEVDESGSLDMIDGFFSSGVQSTDLISTTIISDIDSSSFEIYEINKQYLEYAVSNSFLSSIDLGVAETQTYYTDGKQYRLEIPDEMIRTFDIDGSSCTLQRDDLIIYDNEGNEVTASTKPFYYDGEDLIFQSFEDSDQGVYDWTTLGVSFVINEPFYSEEELDEDL